MADRSYDAAIAALGTLISGKKRPNKGGTSWAHDFESLPIHLQRMGLDARLQQLHVVHVAGTKGKGSTCALVESMLRSCGYTTGLCTSPHLCDVRERIRLNGKPIDQARFLRHFWQVFDVLKRQSDDKLGMPAYFRFLTLLALHVFVEEAVEAVVLEVGLGGRLDATNCVPPPAVTAVTPLGYDHMEILGNTLTAIAGEKAGIFKHGSPAFTVPQEEEAMLALQARADAIGVDLRVVRPWAAYAEVAPTSSDAQHEYSEGKGAEQGALSASGVQPALTEVQQSLLQHGQHQLINAALAVQLAAVWEQRTAMAMGVDQQGSPNSDTAARAASETSTLTVQAEAKGSCSSIVSSSPDAVTHPASGTPALEPAVNGAFLGRLAEGLHRAALVDRQMLPAEYAQGLMRVHWPGRCQVIPDPTLPAPAPLSFYLDGAHTPESMLVAADWFATVTGTQGPTNGAAGVAANSCGSSVGQSNGHVATNVGLQPAQEQHRNGSADRHGQQVAVDRNRWVPRGSQGPGMPSDPLRLLLFHCTEERDPETLLSPLLQQLAERGAPVSHALFVPPDSAYGNLSKHQDDVESPERYARHIHMRSVFETLQARIGAPSAVPAVVLPPLPSVPGIGTVQHAARGAVMPGVQATLDWLRRTVSRGPASAAPHKVMVLVTGSLYLVGDMLRMLDCAP